MIRAHQPGSEPIDIPETIPNPVVTLQLTFPHDTLVRLVHAFYPIFKLAVSRTQDEGLCAMP